MNKTISRLIIRDEKTKQPKKGKKLNEFGKIERRIKVHLKKNEE